MNFFAQFTHRGENASTELKFISTRAELIDVLNGRYSMEPDSPLHDLLGHLGEEILEAACIDVTIYGRGHFSKAWIINPQHAIQRAHLGEKSTPSTPRAAILVANSMSECGGGDHDPEKVARKLRTLMNCLEKHHRNSGGRAFHVKSVPLKILRVPQQNTGWTCGYECMVLSHLMRKYILTNGPITRETIEGNIETVEHTLAHDTPDSALALRSSNAPIDTPMKGPPQTCKPSTFPETPSCSEDDDESISDKENVSKDVSKELFTQSANTLSRRSNLTERNGARWQPMHSIQLTRGQHHNERETEAVAMASSPADGAGQKKY
mmetsp:Transcript_10598/g.25606  ORF Transcript_10598/g.25606 Transcript_10598/m.25606 type:complete len:322 (-) Transcript_10598:48-1013(-)